MDEISKEILNRIELKGSGKPLEDDAVWFINTSEQDRNSFISSLSMKNCTFIQINGVHHTIGYSAIAPLLRKIIFILHGEGKHDLLKNFGPEILYLFPDLKEVELLHNMRVLEDIALSPSRRRLHKESEQMFRVTQMIVTLLLKYIEFLDHDVILYFNELEKMDEHTIRCFARLAKCSRDYHVILTASVSSAMKDDSRFDMKSDTEVNQFVHLADNRNLLMRNLHDRLAPRVFEIESLHSEDPSIHLEDTKLTLNQNADKEKTFSVEGILFTAEIQKSQKLAEILISNASTDLDSQVIDALETAVFTQNYEHALSLADHILTHQDKLNNETILEVWIHIAMCYAFMQDFEKSLELYKHAHQFVEDHLQYAELNLYISLLYIKRLNQPLLGRELLNDSIQSLEKLEGAKVEVERTWLHNLKALSYVEMKELDQAYIHCRKGLEYIKRGDRSENAIHIKINLISNITVLQEYTNKIELALKNWMKFDKFVESSSTVFAKHYLYRKAGLYYKLGELDQATHCLQQSFQIANQLNDSFHKDVIGRALGAIYFEQEQIDEATKWYKESLKAKKSLLQEEEIPRVSLALSICLEKLGEFEQANQVLHESLRWQPSGSSADQVIMALRKWNDREGEGEDSWGNLVDWAIQKPETKLNRPFDLTNLY
jgi:tetratricopeptide (TPR) repeat protein